MVAIRDKNVPLDEQVIVENLEKETVYRKWLGTDRPAARTPARRLRDEDLSQTARGR